MVGKIARMAALAGAMAVGTFLVTGNSVAGTACTVPVNDLDNNLLDNVSGNLGCQLGSTNNDLPLDDTPPGTNGVNQDSMFGITDWIKIGDELKAVGSNGSGLTISGSVINGSYSISNALWSLYDSFMLVFKDGNGDPSVYVGYLLGTQSGSFVTPFLNIKTCNTGQTPPCTEYKGISHWTLYASGEGGGSEVPLPGALGLMLAGLGGLGALSRMRKRA